MSDSGVSRRHLLLGVAAGAVATAGGASSTRARTIQGEVPWAPGEADAPTPVGPGRYIFFTPEEAAFVEAAVARIIPTDELGPGAREAGCAFFIDRQIAGAYGHAERMYMQGPWAKGEKTQGYQSRLTPAQLYRAAIKAVDDHCRKNFGKKPFAQIGPDDQDKVLSRLEDGELALDGADAPTFFKLLLQNTQEGYFADPLYGGNKNMAAWRMIGFPGARYNYRDFVGKHGQRYPLPPVAIQGRPDWKAQSG